MGDTFDLQIDDANIDEEVNRDAIILFTHWANKKFLTERDILLSQRLTVWRPKRNVALISSRMDLSELIKKLPKITVKSFTVLFRHENVLRLKMS